jgi:hypothetical protein
LVTTRFENPANHANDVSCSFYFPHNNKICASTTFSLLFGEVFFVCLF